MFLNRNGTRSGYNLFDVDVLRLAYYPFDKLKYDLAFLCLGCVLKVCNLLRDRVYCLLKYSNKVFALLLKSIIRLVPLLLDALLCLVYELYLGVELCLEVLRFAYFCLRECDACKL